MTILVLPWRPWNTRQALDAHGNADTEWGVGLDDLTVIIPARNEATVIRRTLEALSHQNRQLKVILVDDQSSDGTAAIARSILLPQLQVIEGQPKPASWSGKLWALEQGLQWVTTDLAVLLDADIELQPGSLKALRWKMAEEKLGFLSLMAQLRMDSFWEKLLMPAFVYFFKLLYPFQLSNSPFRWVAAGAGGCIMLETRILREIGGFAAIKGALIDDCSLARKMKQTGAKTWIGLTHSAVSLRPYPDLRSIWTMVARTAYTQLRYSPLLLGLCLLLMFIAFIVPALGLAYSGVVPLMAALTIGLMTISYGPTLSYYGLSPIWGLGLPIIGVLFLGMTCSSAVNYYSGTGVRWKGRHY